MTNETLLFEKRIYSRHDVIEAESRTLYDGLRTNNYIILQSPDEYGFFIYKNNYNNEEELSILLHTYECRSLYKGFWGKIHED